MYVPLMYLASIQGVLKYRTGTSIRLPIGYFTLGPDYCKGTPFEPYGAVYANAWGSVKRFVTNAREHGVGVLVDLHALPGGANPGEYSGTNLKVVNLWKNTTNLDLAMQCLNFIAKEVGGTDGIIGIQLCNEAVTNADGMYDWYDEVLKAVSAVDSTIPLFISDAWDFGKAVNYVKSKNRVLSGDTQRQNPVVIDT
jgi:aryl-phospho-beta-D-glucosidase BglC (GH1 family)